MSARAAISALVPRAALIVLAGAGLGLLANPVTPRPLALSRPVFAASASGTATCSGAVAKEPTRISQGEARSACDACTAAFVDARGENAFALGHIAGALHLPPSGHPDESSTLDHLKGYKTVVVYDDDVGCRLAEGAARRLLAAGLTDVRVLDGNWSTWASSGGPAQSGACEECTRHPSAASRDPASPMSGGASAPAQGHP